MPPGNQQVLAPKVQPEAWSTQEAASTLARQDLLLVLTVMLVFLQADQPRMTAMRNRQA
jgi:hypothetical protein